MKDNLNHINKYRVRHPLLGDGVGRSGMFEIISPFQSSRRLRIICSDGKGWDHVSVSCNGRCPNWNEMNYIKDLFFKDDETTVQFHPKKSEYVNNCEYCLHIWRNQKQEHELPPSILTGIKK